MSAAAMWVREALLARLGGDQGVADVLGEPMRVLGSGSNAPAYPCLEIARHEVRPADSSGTEGEDHRLDLAVIGPEDAEDILLAGLHALRAALPGWKPESGDWRCVLLAPVYADALRAPGRMRRATLRVRMVVEKVSDQ